MLIISKILIGLVAVEHVYILILQMFFWTKPKTKKIFAIDDDLAAQTVSIAANQGLYNGFLAAGLIWGMLHSNVSMGYELQMFFLICVMSAAIYGSVTVKKSILLVQGFPAFLAFVTLLILS